MVKKEISQEETKKTAEEADGAPKKGPALFWIVSISAVLFLGTSVWLNVVEIPELMDELSYQRDTIFGLTEEIDRLHTDVIIGEEIIWELEGQLKPFVVAASQRYGPDQEKALKQLSEDIQKLTPPPRRPVAKKRLP